MTALAGRIVQAVNGTEPVLRTSGTTLSVIATHLDAGKPLDAMGLEPLDILAALAIFGLGPDDSEGLPLVQGGPARPSWERALSEPALAAILPDTPGASLLTIASGLLQVHDFWDASHEAAQTADDLGEKRFSPYWHGIGHRREPDYGNAAYWFRRVGRHPLFPALGAAAMALAEAEGGELARRAPVDRQGAWDPDAFSRLHRDAQRGGPLERLVRRLQRLEMAMLLDATVTELGLA